MGQQFERRSSIQRTEVNLTGVEMDRGSVVTENTTTLGAGASESVQVAVPSGEMWEVVGIMVSSDSTEDHSLTVTDDTTGVTYYDNTTGVNGDLAFLVDDGDVVINESNGITITLTNTSSNDWTAAREYFVVARRYI